MNGSHSSPSLTPGETPAAIWSANGLTYGYPASERPAVLDVSLRLNGGSFTALLGPNGSGKSTLLRLLLGAIRPQKGEISYGGRSLHSWSRAELALEIGVVPQAEEIAFPMSVRDLVAMGRYPHLGPWKREAAADREAIDRAMQLCDVLAMRGRPISTLSGGERQRARISRALAQEPRVLALDEPTVALDVSHEMAIFELLRTLCASGVTVLLVTHNLNLAARFADRLILMADGRIAAEGAPTTVLDHSLLERVYGWPLRTTSHPGPGPDTGAPQVTPLAAPTGEQALLSRATTVSENHLNETESE
ncbi:heme ABC transporter ATP-binding protein [soil metagenome]